VGRHSYSAVALREVNARAESRDARSRVDWTDAQRQEQISRGLEAEAAAESDAPDDGADGELENNGRPAMSANHPR
jgi:hypothetical protein